MTKISFDVDFSQDPEKILQEIQKRAEAEVAKREAKDKLPAHGFVESSEGRQSQVELADPSVVLEVKIRVSAARQPVGIRCCQKKFGPHLAHIVDSRRCLTCCEVLQHLAAEHYINRWKIW